MPLKDLDIERVYDTSYEDASESFFNPVLSEADVYRRASAYFSSASFSLIAAGISSMLWNGGKIEMLIGNPRELSEEDYNAIESSQEGTCEAISHLFPSREELEEMMENENVRALALLLQSRRLEMKFVLPRRSSRLFHAKFGIIIDYLGDGIAFAGSPNETLGGIGINVEVFNTFKSWVPGQSEYYRDYYALFEKYWSGDLNGDAIVLDIPEALRESVIEAKEGYVKKHKMTLYGEQTEGLLYLRPYQRQALEYWRSHGRVCMLEMATGTGKTKTAFACIKNLFKEGGRVPVIIAVPTAEVARQWSSGWFDVFGEYPKVYESGKNSRESVRENASVLGKEAVIIGTYSFLSGKYFSNKVLPYLTRHKPALVADEAHHAGAKEFRNVLDNAYLYRLGLSATPIRQFDDEGSSVISNFFGKNQFSYSLGEAIKDGYLSKYKYYPKFAELSDDEIYEYAQLTKKMLKAFAEQSESDLSADREKYEYSRKALVYARAKVIKKASAKYLEMRSILESLKNKGELSRLMVFCEDTDQLRIIVNELASKGVNYRIMSGKTPDAERAKIISNFSSGNLDCIVAMKVLDEGVDIGLAERAILMSSAKDPRQYVQRVGRVLRIYPSKSVAEIYDVIVYASPAKIGTGLAKVEKSIIKGELERAFYFSRTADNDIECFRTLEAFGHKINIDIWLFNEHD